MRDLSRYGPWAVVAGASEGIGAAFAAALVRGGLNVALVARRRDPLAELAASLRNDRTEVLAVPADLGTEDGFAAVRDATKSLEVGFVVANAAYAPIGTFLDVEEARLRQAIDLNCTSPLRLARHYLPPMAQRGRGGFIVMSSLAGQQGSPGITTYAATKAFGAVLAEGLWAEMRTHGVDVVASRPARCRRPAWPAASPKRAPGTVTPEAVATAALEALGHGPRTVPGGLMKFSSALTHECCRAARRSR